MSGRKMKALGMLRRLRKMELDREAVFLSEIRAEEAQVEQARADAKEMLKRDTAEVPVEHVKYVGGYVKALFSEIRSFEDRLASLQNQAYRQERLVIRQYSEFKAVDLHLEKMADENAEREKSRECKELDELSLLRFSNRR